MGSRRDPAEGTRAQHVVAVEQSQEGVLVRRLAGGVIAFMLLARVRERRRLHPGAHAFWVVHARTREGAGTVSLRLSPVPEVVVA